MDQPEGEGFDIYHAEGHSWGYWQYHFELEIRKFNNNAEHDIFYIETSTKNLNTYCRTGAEVVVPYLYDGGAINDRYQCAWPAEWNGSSYDYSAEFQIIPDEHEEMLIQHVMDLVD